MEEEKRLSFFDCLFYAFTAWSVSGLFICPETEEEK